MSTEYCKNCDTIVTPRTSWSAITWFIHIVLLIATVGVWFIPLLVSFMCSSESCPLCRSRNFAPAWKAKRIRDENKHQEIREALAIQEKNTQDAQEEFRVAVAKAVEDKARSDAYRRFSDSQQTT